MKERLDVLLVKKGLAPSREKAKAVIMAGSVYVDGQKEDKAGSVFDEESAQIEVRGHVLPYVSRGGLKLEKALKVFPITLTDKICMDIGASTGGFTDCMLQHGARLVYALDVGHGQLHESLRFRPDVVNLEGMDIRDGEGIRKIIPPASVQFCSVDVSFISIKKILDALPPLLERKAWAVLLIKPQFEAGREQVGKKGVVRDKSVHLEVIKKVLEYALSIGFSVLNLEFSPIKGPEGNIEYLAHLKKQEEGMAPESCPVDPERIVEQAHQTL